MINEFMVPMRDMLKDDSSKYDTFEFFEAIKDKHQIYLDEWNKDNYRSLISTFVKICEEKCDLTQTIYGPPNTTPPPNMVSKSAGGNRKKVDGYNSLCLRQFEQKRHCSDGKR